MKNSSEVTRKNTVTKDQATKEERTFTRGWQMPGTFYVPALTADKASDEAISEALGLLDVKDVVIDGKERQMLLVLIIDATTEQEIWVEAHRLKASKDRCELETTELEQEINSCKDTLTRVITLAGRTFHTVPRDVHTVAGRSFFRLHEVK